MKTKINIFIIIFTVLACFVIIKPIKNRTEKIKAQQEKRLQLEEEIKVLKEKNEELKKEIEEAKQNSNIEKISRNNLNMSKEGEKVYIFIDKKEKK